MLIKTFHCEEGTSKVFKKYIQLLIFLVYIPHKLPHHLCTIKMFWWHQFSALASKESLTMDQPEGLKKKKKKGSIFSNFSSLI